VFHQECYPCLSHAFLIDLNSLRIGSVYVPITTLSEIVTSLNYYNSAFHTHCFTSHVFLFFPDLFQHHIYTSYIYRFSFLPLSSLFSPHFSFSSYFPSSSHPFSFTPAPFFLSLRYHDFIYIVLSFNARRPSLVAVSFCAFHELYFYIIVILFY